MGNPSKPIWQSDAFIILCLVIFWPAGIFLMWKYSPWRKFVKGLLTAFFLIGVIPLLFIWSLLSGLRGYSLIDNLLNPRTVNQSKLYNCVVLNFDWGKCTNRKHNFSFEYPAKWSYIDLKPEGIGFSPSDKNMSDGFVISMGSPSEWKSEEEAKKFANGYSGSSSRQETTIDGLYATKDYKAFSENGIVATAVIVDGKTTYEFMSLPDNLKKASVSLTNSELQSIFDHMANSFAKEK
ncbi:hypothetical protein FJZ40_01870 [Candidatus Shapirobacteria bacterium]|nr:hypothetical protein [Candidatus Shapirobacteria bacterium]